MSKIVPIPTVNISN